MQANDIWSGGRLIKLRITTNIVLILLFNTNSDSETIVLKITGDKKNQNMFNVSIWLLKTSKYSCKNIISKFFMRRLLLLYSHIVLLVLICMATVHAYNFI